MSLHHPIAYGAVAEKLNQFLQENEYSQVIIFCDENTSKLCYPLLNLPKNTPVITMPAGEANKTITTCEMVWQNLLHLGADRKSLLINLGGGIVTDLGGFAASCYKRGIDFVNIPTSLLAMVDASSGGKTGVNFGSIKNSIGAFSIPQTVLVDEAFLATLPARHLKNGMAEIIKHGLIANKDHIAELEEAMTSNSWQAVIEKSVNIKRGVVASDPYEKGLRKTLNFGHTIGHAIESYSLKNEDQPLLHGEAIALGMIAEAYLSMTYCGLSESDYQITKDLILSHFEKRNFDNTAHQEMISLMKNDKKNKGESIRMSLLEQIGVATFDIEVGETGALMSLQTLNA